MVMRIKRYFLVQGILAAIVCVLQAIVVLPSMVSGSGVAETLPIYAYIPAAASIASIGQALLTFMTSVA
jgi:uncharacterized circularly permuted ATP-grasp superfamily protein